MIPVAVPWLSCPVWQTGQQSGHQVGRKCVSHPSGAEDVSPVDRRHRFPMALTVVPPPMLQVKLVQHTYSCLYGTFLGNSPCEREMHNIYKRTCSVWSLLRAGNKNFHNLLYMPGSEQVSRAPGPAFQAFRLSGTRDWVGRGWRGFLLHSSLIVSGCCRCCTQCATCERCTSGQQCISQLPRPIPWDRMIWIFTCPLDLRARSSVADVWTGKSLESPILGCLLPAGLLSLLAHCSSSALPVVLIFPVESKSSVVLSQPLREERVRLPAAPRKADCEGHAIVVCVSAPAAALPLPTHTIICN